MSDTAADTDTEDEFDNVGSSFSPKHETIQGALLREKAAIQRKSAVRQAQ